MGKLRLKLQKRPQSRLLSNNHPSTRRKTMFYRPILSAREICGLIAYPSQGHEMLFDAHTRAFAALGGIPRRGIYDNMKTAVDKGRTKARGAWLTHASPSCAATTCSILTFAMWLQVGRKALSRRNVQDQPQANLARGAGSEVWLLCRTQRLAGRQVQGIMG